MASYAVITISTTQDQALPAGDIVAGKRPLENIQQIARFLNGVANGSRTGTTIDYQLNGVAGVRASGTFTIAAGNLAAADTVTVQGVALTAVASGANGTTQFNVGAATPSLNITAAYQTAINVAAAINANTTTKQYVVATAAPSGTTGVVTISSLDYGPLSNAITLAKTAVNGTVSGATLAGGTRVANAFAL